MDCRTTFEQWIPGRCRTCQTVVISVYPSAEGERLWTLPWSSMGRRGLSLSRQETDGCWRDKPMAVATCKVITFHVVTIAFCRQIRFPISNQSCIDPIALDTRSTIIRDGEQKMLPSGGSGNEASDLVWMRWKSVSTVCWKCGGRIRREPRTDAMAFLRYSLAASDVQEQNRKSRLPSGERSGKGPNSRHATYEILSE